MTRSSSPTATASASAPSFDSPVRDARRCRSTATYTINRRDRDETQNGTYSVTLEAVSATADGQWNGPPNAPGADAPVCQRTNAAGKADGTQVVSVGAPVGGTIDSPGETDTFTFVADAERVVTLQVALLLPAAGPFMPRARLFDPAGQPWATYCLARRDLHVRAVSSTGVTPSRSSTSTTPAPATTRCWSQIRFPRPPPPRPPRRPSRHRRPPARRSRRRTDDLYELSRDAAPARRGLTG